MQKKPAGELTVGNVVLHPCLVIDLKLSGLRRVSPSSPWAKHTTNINRSTQLRVVFPRVFTIAITFGVVNVLRLRWNELTPV